MLFSTAFKALAATALLAQSAGAIQAVTRAGRYLYTADGNRFYIRGIAYQEQGPFSTSLGTSRDLIVFFSLL